MMIEVRSSLLNRTVLRIIKKLMIKKKRSIRVHILEIIIKEEIGQKEQARDQVFLNYNRIDKIFRLEALGNEIILLLSKSRK